jgi:hypothetical protein
MSDVSAKDIWQRKLNSLQAEEATAVDPEIKFKLEQDIATARRKLHELEAETAATSVTGHSPRDRPPIPADISRIIKYAPVELIGREAETQLLNDTWAKAQNSVTKRPRVLTFVALGGEGKTSLVAKWAADLAYQNWPGCDAAFAWSFYSQGAREQVATSSDVFLKEALTFFGDPAMAGSAQGAFDKGRRLTQLAGERRALLILDGLEPLQNAPTSPTPGELKDSGLAALLKGLAANSKGLCVVTTRYSIPDMRAYWQTTAPQVDLLRLSKEAGVALLRSFGVNGTQTEFETLVEEVKGHALTLNLLGAWLRDAHAGDIRKRDLVRLEEADEEQGGHAFRVMDAYVRWLESEGRHGKRALAVLRLMGLFDRPADASCLKALWKAPFIPDLTEPLAGISEAHRNLAMTRLKDAKLLTVNRDGSGALLALDAHPLLRKYFAQQLREQHPEAWRDAHRRLYQHLCATTEGPEPTLEDLQPLYQAVAHGCQAGMLQEASEKVFYDRILRGPEEYATHTLGAIGSDLGAIACFFEHVWSRVSPALRESTQGWLLNEAAFRLRALGRLTEALEPMRAAVGMGVRQEQWRNVARGTANLSELDLTLGNVALAVVDAGKSVTYAERSGDTFRRILTRTVYADALHQAGRREESEARFREAEVHPLLYSGLFFSIIATCSSPSPNAPPGDTRSIYPASLNLYPCLIPATPSLSARHRPSKIASVTTRSSTSPLTTSPWAGPRFTRWFWTANRVTDSILAASPSSTPWTASTAPGCKITSPVASSPGPGCAFSPTRAPAPRARKATSTRPLKSPSAGRCRCTWRISICIERGCLD